MMIYDQPVGLPPIGLQVSIPQSKGLD